MLIFETVSPVESVTWYEAEEFCKRLSRRADCDYRLPSEAEWEYACRAKTHSPFHFGETISTELSNYRGTDLKQADVVYPGNYGFGPHGKYREVTTKAGSFPANGFGLFDMHGNVLEWCADWWHKSYAGAPQGGTAWQEGGRED